MFKKDRSIWSPLGWVVAGVLLATSGATAQTGAAAGRRDLVLEGGTLIDGTGKAPIADAVIVMEAGRIKAVGKRGQVPVPANATIIKLDGRTVLPGLIDSHVHLQEWQLPMFLPYGVTTIAELNNDGPWILAQREALKSGKIKGPRMFVSGTFLWGPLAPRAGGTFNTPPMRTPEQARARVRALVASGVDIIKVDLGISDDVLRAIIEEANRAGLPALGHTQNILRATQLGFKHEEHMDTMARALLDPDEKNAPRFYPTSNGPVPLPQIAPESIINPKQFPPLIAYMVKQGVFVNPTLVNQWYPSTPRWQEGVIAAKQMVKDPGLDFVPEDVKAAWTRPPGPPRDQNGQAYAHVAEFLREYSEAGGKVIVGTDTGFDPRGIPGLAVDYEMQMLVDVGIPPMKVIQGATLWNAQLLKKDKDLGSVEPGKLADITVIDGNPLANISAVKNVRMVIKDGQLMDTKYDPKWVNPIPQPFSTAFSAPPQITDLSPRAARQGGQTVTLTIEGNKFAPNAVVQFDGAALPTHFVSSTQLTAILDARFLRRSPGSYVFDVLNPGTHGTVSTPGYFLVDFKQ